MSLEADAVGAWIYTEKNLNLLKKIEKNSQESEI